LNILKRTKINIPEAQALKTSASRTPAVVVATLPLSLSNLVVEDVDVDDVTWSCWHGIAHMILLVIIYIFGNVSGRESWVSLLDAKASGTFRYVFTATY
jgi:hypothetical protein